MTEIEGAPATPLDVETLRIFLDGRYREIREQAREGLERPEFAPVVGLAKEEYRELVLDWTKTLAATGETSLGYPVEYGGRDDPGASVAAFETLAHGDLSLLVKVGVQFGLWGGAVLHVGTKRHHDAYLADTARLDLAGCFAMTETGHGSNVQALRTTATYDQETQEFVVNTPDDDARKDYIGNAACHASMAAVFAQLIVGGESREFTPSPSRSATSPATRCPGSGSRTAARSWGSTASTTAGSGSTRCASRATPCSTAMRRSTRTASTRARSTTRTGASSP